MLHGGRLPVTASCSASIIPCVSERFFPAWRVAWAGAWLGLYIVVHLDQIIQSLIMLKVDLRFLGQASHTRQLPLPVNDLSLTTFCYEAVQDEY